MIEGYKIPKELAERVVDILHNITGDNVNVMDEKGIIIATKQVHRLGTVHEGARKIIEKEADFVAITEEQSREMDGVLPGYNGPIKIDDECIGCIGLTGNPERVRPLQELASIIVTGEIKKDLELAHERNIINNIAEKIDVAYNSISEVAAGAENIASTSQVMEELSQNVELKLDDINRVVDLISGIVAKTNLLGINAAIEAARAGEYGRGFSIVAEETQRLSSDSTNSLKTITKVLEEIKNAVYEITQGICQNAEETTTQADAINEIERSIAHIQKETEKFSDKNYK